MMSPRPPPQPIHPRNTIPSSPMVESPRPMPLAVLPPHHPQLPQPTFSGTSAMTSRFPGPHLVPLASLVIPSPSSGSTLPPPAAQQPLAHPPLAVPQHAPSPPQTPHGKGEGQRVSATYGRLIPSQPFGSPAPPGYPSPMPFADPGHDRRRFSVEAETERRRYAKGPRTSYTFTSPSSKSYRIQLTRVVRLSISSLIPSPPYTSRRVVDDGLVDEHQRHSGYGSRFTPTSVDDAVTTRQEAPAQRRSVSNICAVGTIEAGLWR